MLTCQTSVRDPTRPIPQAHMDLWRAFVRHRLKDIPCTSDGSDWAQVKCVHGRQESRCKACGSRLRPTSDASSGARANAPARTERGGRIPVCLHRRSRSTRKECGGAQKSAGAPHTKMLSQASAAELARWIELNIALSTVVGADGSIQYRYWIRRAGARAHGRPDFFRNTTGRFAAFRTPNRQSPAVCKNVPRAFVGCWSEHFASKKQAWDAIQANCGHGKALIDLGTDHECT
jgi:hypothetical protein